MKKTVKSKRKYMLWAALGLLAIVTIIGAPRESDAMILDPTIPPLGALESEMGFDPLVTNSTYFSDWDLDGKASVRDGYDFFELYTSEITPYSPTEGSYFLMLDDPDEVYPDGLDYSRIDDPFDPDYTVDPAFTEEYYGSHDNDGDGILTDFGDIYSNGTILSSHLILEDGEELRFDWNFLPYDYATGYMDTNDFALLAIEGLYDDALFTPFDHLISSGVSGSDIQYSYALLSDVESRDLAHDFGYGEPSYSTGWETFSWTPTGGFSGAVQWVVGNGDDSYNPSGLLLDGMFAGLPPSNTKPNAPVPEPGTITLMGLGLSGLGLLRRRKKAAGHKE